jgi:hypothetical protein
MRNRLLLAALLLSAIGCPSPLLMDRQALRYHDNGTVDAQLGNGPGAAYNIWRAHSLREGARLVSQQHSTWLYYDLTLN